MQATFLSLIILLTSCLHLQAKVHHVGAGQQYATINHALVVTKPGDTIMVHEGNYEGGNYIASLQGTAARPIHFVSAPNERVVFQGGVDAWHLVDAAHVYIKGFTFQQQTGNGFNIDDGGTYNTPSHHIIFDSCTFRNIHATGNNDLLKMSGVDFFTIRNCHFLNGAAGGSGIDMVGCHDGTISGNRFENLGSNSIQAKGGSRNIKIEYNYFNNGGERTLNLGGSTNMQLFRPPDARYEAAQLTVYSNIFIGSDVPIAYVGCVQTSVLNNTIYLPQKWVIRILQETADSARFYPCGNNIFSNNIIYHDNRVIIDCNIGPNTNAPSFSFSNNLWYHSQNAAWAGPVLPVKETGSVIGKDPLFMNAPAGDLSLKKESEAAGKGYKFNEKVPPKRDPL